MLDSEAKPQILEHLNKSLNLTVYETKWIPSSARFVALGSYAKNTGSLQVFEMSGNSLKVQTEVEKPLAFKCGTFGASDVVDRRLATGNFGGHLEIWDLEHLSKPVYKTQAHASIVNQMDGCGGQAKGCGPPELVTCGRDGAVRVWDIRQQDAPVAAFEPSSSDAARDCWCVAFGNSFNDEERCILAGYDNGDVKMFDLRTNTVRWETNVRNGVCAVSFDRKDIPMNKFTVTCLEAQFHTFDARTQHPKKGFASVKENLTQGSTIWHSAPLPQNRDISMVATGDGTLNLYKYHYPDSRTLADPASGENVGVAGRLELLSSRTLSSQPICGFDWSPDKMGLFCCSAYDQCVRVGIVTKLNTA